MFKSHESNEVNHVDTVSYFGQTEIQSKKAASFMWFNEIY